MSKTILLGARPFANGLDLTANANLAELTSTVEAKDSTTYASNGWHELLGGLADSQITMSGFWEANDLSKVDDSSWAALGGKGPWSICPINANAGSLVYFTSALEIDDTFFGAVGDINPFKVTGHGSWPLVRGVVANAPGTVINAGGSGAANLLGPVVVGDGLHAAIHVLSVSGTASPTLNVTVQSDDNAGFTSPATVATFTAATAIGGQIIRSAGPITDTYFRMIWTVSGTTPSFLFLGALGIQ